VAIFTAVKRSHSAPNTNDSGNYLESWIKGFTYVTAQILTEPLVHSTQQCRTTATVQHQFTPVITSDVSSCEYLVKTCRPLIKI